MRTIIILSLTIFSSIGFAIDVQSAESKVNSHSSKNIVKSQDCKIKGNAIHFGLCIDDDYHRLPSSSIRYYAVDYEKYTAFYFEKYSAAHFNRNGELVFSKPKFKQKLIRLSQQQVTEIEKIANSVVVHVDTYQRNSKQKRAEEWEKYSQERKAQEEDIARKTEICSKNNSCPEKFEVPYIFAPDELDLTPFSMKTENDLLEQSFHYSQKLIIKNETIDLTFGGGGQFVQEASKLLSYIETLFPKKFER